ncbi:MAG: glycosyltransferase family 2 protein, partial [Candidatus Aureabacteria bacterium]|nr:glycosyltransferase family 2 protein [Candidatus Auribacterota bacterium]
MGKKPGDDGIYLTVVIPAYNEEPRLGTTLDRVLTYLAGRGYAYEVVVVDDGSRDGTARVAEAYAAAHPEVRCVRNGVNRGKGFSVRRGVEEAAGGYILFSDADLSTPIEDIEQLLPKIRDEGFDIAIGSRGLHDSDVRVHQPWYRELMGKIFNKIVRLVTLRGISDTQCGFKLFKGDVAREIFALQRIERFSFDVEALYLAKKRGCRIAEVPISWYNSPRSRVSILGDPARMFMDVLRIRLYDLRGMYRRG